jgi:uncharacterized RDD family membrane protein YckC
MTDPSEVSTASDGPGDSAGPTRAIAGFWRRLGAFAIDVAVLWAIGRGLAFFAYDELVALDGGGWLIGFAVTTLYWGWCNSQLGGGGTLGKWLCGIEVVDLDGARLGVGRSIWRAFVLTLPYFLPSGPIRLNWFGYFVLVTELAVPLAALYLASVNRRNRQSIDDIAARSFVVLRKGHGRVRARPTWRIHAWVLALIAVGCWSYVVDVSTPPSWAHQSPNNPEWRRAEYGMKTLRKPEFSGGVSGRFFGLGSHHRTDEPEIVLDADWHSRPANPEFAAAQVVATLVAAMPDAKHVKQIEVQLKYGYRIGIGSDFHEKTFVHSPNEWLLLVRN